MNKRTLILLALEDFNERNFEIFDDEEQKIINSLIDEYRVKE